MSNMANSSRPQPGTYAVQGAASDKELNRLRLLDQMVTTVLGGTLPEQSDPTRFEHVLDVGCGPGGWLFEASRTYPGIPRLVGVDINEKMIHAARDQAKALRVDKRVEFHQMDALVGLDFPDASFDLINVRFGGSWLRTWDWHKFLPECLRVARPGAVLRLTEGDKYMKSSSSAFMQLNDLTLRAFYQAGYLFAPQDLGLTDQLMPLLERHGLVSVQAHVHLFDYRAGTPEGQLFVENFSRIYRVIVPFLSKWIRLPDNYEELYQQMLQEMRQPNFVTTSRGLTAWGICSPTPSLLSPT